MTLIFTASRNAARALPVGKLMDFGPEAEKGKRYARAVSLCGNARQRRKALRAMVRNAGH